MQLKYTLDSQYWLNDKMVFKKRVGPLNKEL